MDFVAVDFETANSDRGSICALGIVVVSEGVVVRKVRRLVRPLRLDHYMHWYNKKRLKMSLGGRSLMEYRQALGYV